MIFVSAQQPDTAKTIIRSAGTEYLRSPFYQSLWGHNYRQEWATPVSFPILMLDTAFGGLVPYKEGGGHQSKSLHLKTKEGKQYAMRSVNKTLKVVIPEIFYNTFVEHLANDEISMSHPYAALSVPKMAEAANIYHTYPKYVYLPQQPALDSFNEKYANTLYLLEQRPDEDWSNADNLGNFKGFISSEQVRENIFEDNSREVDQLAFVKARLFDMFLGDWDRHEEQWKWGSVEKNKRKFYVPVPVDRDQAYSRFDGLLLKTAISAAGAKYFQSFDYDIPYPEGFSYERRNVDRFFTNKVTLDEWQRLAMELQSQLTDDVIERSLRQLPTEIFSINGEDIIAKMKSRRGHLIEYATKYYLFMAKEVNVVGSKEREYFEVKRISDHETEVNVYSLKNNGKSAAPYYSRKFLSGETNEIRLFGLSGKDIYDIKGNVSKGIKIRIIGGDKIDSVSISGKGRKVQIYDDHNKNIFELHSRARLHLSSDSTVHAFDYDAFRPEKKGIKPAVGYNDEDRVFVGLGYGWQHQSFRKVPFSFRQSIGVNYSISQKAFSTIYTGIFPKTIDGWDVLLKGYYDAVKWTNFFGVGNETKYFTNKKNYFRLRTAEWLGNIGLNRLVGISNISISAFYNSVKILRDSGKFIRNNYLPVHPENFRTNSFVGGLLRYNIIHVNDSIVPVSGIIFNAAAGYTKNLKDDDRSFANFSGDVQLYIPLIPKISLAISTGAATVSGTPEFYQYPTIGGGSNVRGFLRDRFRGKTTFYNSNELRFITNVNTYLMNGKAGLVAFFDDGRVWMPGEISNSWHSGYGGGILVAPFNIMFFDITYGVSEETTQIQMRVRMKL
ncbi:MAG: BamA/TamA family outer membrane protein [Ginsengibacter sp.]